MKKKCEEVGLNNSWFLTNWLLITHQSHKCVRLQTLRLWMCGTSSHALLYCNLFTFFWYIFLTAKILWILTSPSIKAWEPFSLRCIRCRRTFSASNLYCASATFKDLSSNCWSLRDSIHQTEWPFKFGCRWRNHKHKFDKARKAAQL